ncbi:unnamed protein product [Miscanthus lutarioriparius]|uniref:Uncharacterized protein n=1 Tax=Miscanthus lutarioriparius TaxID=422564 RepID=A0A811NR15_9POAL|nr:unnamed protein product [Miscanthus lutarioriparius]
MGSQALDPPDPGKDKFHRPVSCLGAAQVPPPLVRRKGAVTGLARKRCRSGPGGTREPPARCGLAGLEPAAGAAGTEAAVEGRLGAAQRPAVGARGRAQAAGTGNRRHRPRAPATESSQPWAWRLRRLPAASAGAGSGAIDHRP